jgi:hypothetical protein
MRIHAKLLLAFALATPLWLLLGATPASAHEERDVGPIHMAVGFGTEPTYVGQPNSVQLFLGDHGKPVIDLGNTLKVTISFGSQTSDAMTLAPAFEIGESGTPGDYRAYFVPSQPGAYTFTFNGTVHGTAIKDQKFVGGPKTFSEAEDMSSATFPSVQVPSAPELATRIQQEAARSQTGLTTAADAASSANDAAKSAKTIGVIGIVVGALGLAAGIGALMRARRA